MLWVIAVLVGCVHRSPEPEAARTGLPPTAAGAPEAARAWFTRGRVAEELGDQVEAERSFTWVVRLDGDSGWSHLALGEYFARQGRREDSITAFRNAVEVDDALAAAHLALGRALGRVGDDPGSRIHLERAVSLGEIEDAPWLLARAWIRAGEPERAHAVWSAWRGASPVFADSILHRGSLAYDLEEWAAAVDDLVAAVEADPSVEVAEILVDAARRSCRIGVAWRWAVDHRIAERGDGLRRVAMNIARSARDPQLLVAALDGEILDLSETQGQVQALLDLGRGSEALAAVRAAQGRLGSLGALVLDEGRALLAMDRRSAAVVAFQRVPITDPHGPRAVESLVSMLLDRGEASDAIAVASSAREQSASAPVVWALARALTAGDRLPEADAQIDAVQAWDEPERLRRRALLRGGSERVEGLERAFAAGSARAAWDLVRVHDAAGRAADAVAVLEVLVERDPGDAQAWVELARRGPQRRREALERALQADPCSHTALRELGSLTGDTALLRRAWEASPVDAAPGYETR